jgi:predicted DCC family thiol-disulfide oxidoreductase YuxK
MDNVIIFDGICNLCNTAVKFIVSKDRKGTFMVVPFQSELANDIIESDKAGPGVPSGILYISSGHRYFKSSAVLHILKDMGGFWRIFYIFIVIPPFIRDSLYNLIAKNRFIFGRRSCTG